MRPECSPASLKTLSELARPRPLHLRGHQLLDHGALEEVRVHAGVQFHRIGQRELAEVFFGDEAVLDHFPGLLDHLRGIGNVEVADIRSHHRLQFQPRLLVEGHHRHRVVGLAAEVEAAGVELADVPRGLDAHAVEVVALPVA